MKIKAELVGRDFIEVECDGEDEKSPGNVLQVKMAGCTDFLDLMQTMRKNFGVDLKKWPVPTGDDHSSLLVREMILKLQGAWNYPYQEKELCHCRMIDTQVVDQAILGGAHTPEKVTRQTSASTACGTCRPQVQKIIDYRLNKKTA